MADEEVGDWLSTLPPIETATGDKCVLEYGSRGGSPAAWELAVTAADGTERPRVQYPERPLTLRRRDLSDWLKRMLRDDVAVQKLVDRTGGWANLVDG
jgi:hypothetical protein